MKEEEKNKDHEFKKGNEFWKQRTKHGRSTKIEDPEELEKGAYEYFQLCIDNPLKVPSYEKDEKMYYTVHLKVFKKDELARFLNLSAWRSINDLKTKSDDFLQVITNIEGIIRDQKYEHAVVGVFKENIIARDLGLKDAKDVNHGGQPSNPIEYYKVKMPENGRDKK
jgi:hypothetical protein